MNDENTLQGTLLSKHHEELKSLPHQFNEQVATTNP
jgi:hypothetical protein